MPRLVCLLSISWLLLAAAPVVGGDPALLELKAGDTTYRGKLLARGASVAWLLDRDGQISRVPLDEVDAFRKVDPRFRSYSSTDLRTHLLREFGKDFEVQGSRHYLVCAAKGQASQYAEIFENVYRTFFHYFAVRGFRVEEPEFPLVALVFPDRRQFAEYCRQDGVTATPGLKGYYMPTTNRVALFASGSEPFAEHGPVDTQELFRIGDSPAHARPLFDPFGHRNCFIADIRPFAKVDGDLRDTIVHEATHQVAFNTGLHSRISENPRWVVEGLATVFEAPGIRSRAENRSINSRMNPDRYVWFGNFVKDRRKPQSLRDFIQNDRMFDSSTLDAYSQAWALSFYLIETRSQDYAKYLKRIAARDPLRSYPAEERMSDFETAFGGNLDVFEANFLRFMERMN